MVLNGAIFHIDYDNQQFFFSGVTDTGVFQNVINIDKTSIDVFWDIANRVSSPSKDFINVGIGVDNERWGLSIFGNNITDERAPTAIGTDVFGTGQHLRTPNKPKSWGAELRFRF